MLNVKNVQQPAFKMHVDSEKDNIQQSRIDLKFRKESTCEIYNKNCSLFQAIFFHWLAKRDDYQTLLTRIVTGNEEKKKAARDTEKLELADWKWQKRHLKGNASSI